jgi:hypothetical protein
MEDVEAQSSRGRGALGSGWERAERRPDGGGALLAMSRGELPEVGVGKQTGAVAIAEIEA